MDQLARPIIALYELSNGILNTGIGDLSDENAKTRSRGGEGPSIAWTIGHLCHYKIKVLNLLGQIARESVLLDLRARGGNRRRGLSAAERPGGELFGAEHRTVHRARFFRRSPRGTRCPAPGSHDEKRIIDTVLFLAWHEAYHIGAIGAIRREQGRKAIADLVRGER